MNDQEESKFIWHGKYSSFVEAENNVKARNSNLPSSKHAGDKESIWYEKQKKYFDEAMRGNLLRNSNLQRITQNSQYSSVFDFGGGSGWQCALLRSAKYEIQIPFFNIELKSTIELFNDQTSTLENYYNLDTSSKPVDTHVESLFYSNSVVQYFPHNKHMIDWIDAIRPQVIVIEDFMGTSSEEFYSAQNYYGYFMVNQGYHLVNELIYSSIINSNMRAEILLEDSRVESIPDAMTLIFDRGTNV